MNDTTSKNTPLEQAIEQARGDRKNGGKVRIAEACGVAHQAVRRWQKNGRFPRSEHVPPEMGGTTYADKISAIPGVTVTAEQLRKWSLQGWQQVDGHQEAS